MASTDRFERIATNNLRYSYPTAYNANNKTLTGRAPRGSVVPVYVDGTLNGTATADDSGNWSLVLGGTITPGQPIRTTNGVAAASRTFTVPTPVTLGALSLAPFAPFAQVPTSVIGRFFSARIIGGSGGTYSLAGAGSAGLTIGNGYIVSGYPTALGPIDVVETLATATNSPRTTSGVTEVTSGAGGGVVPPVPLLSYTPLGIFAVPGYANLTRAYSMKPAVKGGATTGAKVFALSGSLPAGLSFSASTGEITGTPTASVTTSGLAITVTDTSGAATSAPFSITVGAAPVSIAPSGDTTGATDVVAVNNALAAGNSVVLSGTYYANTPIRQPGNTAIYADSGSWNLPAQTNKQLWANANIGSKTRTDQNMSVIGSNGFFFNGNNANQTIQGGAGGLLRNSQGFTAISVQNLVIRGVKINSRAGAVFVLGTVFAAVMGVEFDNGLAGLEQLDGLDIGSGSSFVQVDGITGICRDDVFSFFAKKKQTENMMAAGTPWELGADVSEIYIANVAAQCALQNMFRLQAGNGFKLSGIYGKNIANTLMTGTRILMQTGEALFLDDVANAPLPGDLTNIVLDGVSGFGQWLNADTSVTDVHVYNITQNRPLVKGITTEKSNRPVVYNVSFDGVVDTSSGGHGALADLSVTNTFWTGIEFRNVALSDLATLAKTTTSLQAMVFKNIAIASGSVPAVASTAPGKSAGTFTNVKVAGADIPVSAVFDAIQAGAFNDNFNRADANLSASPNWQIRSGPANGVAVSANVLAANITATDGTAVHAPDTGSLNHYVQAVNKVGSGENGSFLCARLMDFNNYIGSRYNPARGEWEIYQRLAGVLTLLGSSPAAAPGGSGKTMRLEVVGLTAALKIDGVAVIVVPVSRALVSTRGGVNARGTVVASWLDDFETGVQAAISAKLINPRIGLIGPSTTEHNNYGVSDGTVRSGNAASGPFTWAQMENRRGQMLLAGQTTSPFFIGDNRGANGAGFAEYPAQTAGLDARLAVPAAQRIAIYEPGRNDLQDGMSVATYKANVQRDLADLRARGFAMIFLCKPWKKPVAYGGLWVSGGSARAAVDEINVWMETLVAADLKLVNFPAVLTNPANADGDPYPKVTRSDFTHLTNYGGRLAGKAVNTALEPYLNRREFPSVAPSENLFPDFSGTGGTISGTGASGVVVDGWAASYSGSTGTVVASTETLAGKLFQRFTATETAAIPATGANIGLTRSVSVPANKKVGVRMKVKIPATLVPYMLFVTFGGAGAQGVSPSQRVGLIAGVSDATNVTAVGGASANFQSSVKFDGSEDVDLWLETSAPLLTGASVSTINLLMTATIGPSAANADAFTIRVGEVQTFDWPI